MTTMSSRTRSFRGSCAAGGRRRPRGSGGSSAGFPSVPGGSGGCGAGRVGGGPIGSPRGSAPPPCLLRCCSAGPPPRRAPRRPPTSAASPPAHADVSCGPPPSAHAPHCPAKWDADNKSILKDNTETQFTHTEISFLYHCPVNGNTNIIQYSYSTQRQ